MRYNHTKIFQSAYVLTLEIHRAVSRFSKEHKYTTGERLKNICSDTLDLIVIANSSADKLEMLQKIDMQLEKIKIHLRILFDLKTVSPGLLEVLSKQIDDVGRQLGGWRKWAEKKIVRPFPPESLPTKVA